MSDLPPFPYTDTCAACGVILDDDERAANPRVARACEAVRARWSDGDPVHEPVCVDCCASGIPALDQTCAPLDCEGDCAHLVATRSDAA